MTSEIERDVQVAGIYAGYFAGATGASFGLFLFDKGLIAGADAGGAIYDGSYSHTDGFVEGQVTFNVPVSTHLVTGLVASKAMRLEVPFKLPVPINESEVFRFETPAGPVNGKFKLIRRLS